jgi:glucose-1-phosphate thymidylyltransferase
MKGILLAGGNGRRLDPLTSITNKHLLPVYDQPMISYPLRTLVDAGIDEILIISGKDHAGGFLKLLGSGRDYGCTISYEIQEEAGGIAQALALAEKFSDGDSVAVILGDNIFEDSFKKDILEFGPQKGARVFLKEMKDARRFGVAELNGDLIVKIEEKPEQPKTNWAVTGFYLYDNDVFSVIKTLKPSARGELEITDVNNFYIQKGLMKAGVVHGCWTDAGTFESLFRANRIARSIELARQGLSREQILQRDAELLE